MSDKNRLDTNPNTGGHPWQDFEGLFWAVIGNPLCCVGKAAGKAIANRPSVPNVTVYPGHTALDAAEFLCGMAYVIQLVAVPGSFVDANFSFKATQPVLNLLGLMAALVTGLRASVFLARSAACPKATRCLDTAACLGWTGCLVAQSVHSGSFQKQGLVSPFILNYTIAATFAVLYGYRAAVAGAPALEDFGAKHPCTLLDGAEFIAGAGYFVQAAFTPTAWIETTMGTKATADTLVIAGMVASIIFCVRTFFFMARSTGIPAIAYRADIGAAVVWGACVVNGVRQRDMMPKEMFWANMGLCGFISVAFAYRAYTRA